MSGDLYFETYDSGLGREQILCAGKGESRLLIIPPLFDEMHKLRRTLVKAMRALAEHGFASVLPDLPGLNESQTPLFQCSLSDWHEAVRRAAADFGATHIAGLRTACVLDVAITPIPRWRYAPLAGERIATHMVRAQMAGDKAAGLASKREDFESGDAQVTLQLSGYTMNRALLADLKAATMAPLSNGCDMAVEGSLGPALWLRAEPGESAELAYALADSWAKWMAR